MVEQIEDLLRPMPYLVAEGPDQAARFASVAGRARKIQHCAIDVASLIAEQARNAL